MNDHWDAPPPGRPRGREENMMSAEPRVAEGAPVNFRVEVASGVATLWLDEPGEKVNTIDEGMMRELVALLDRLEKDDAVRALVLASGKA